MELSGSTDDLKRLIEGYVGNDHPETWPIPRKTVLMGFQNPNHFRLDAEDGILEWKAMIPGGDGIIHLGAHHQPYGISMFHQLRCLDVIRGETVRDRSDGDNISELGRHCLNYIRQMVMCRGDLELESFQFASHKNPIDLFGVYECKDWEGVYTKFDKIIPFSPTLFRNLVC